MTEATAPRPRPAGGVCLLCCQPVQPAERRCPAFALAGVVAHAGCCGGCATGPARRESAAASLEAAA